MPGDLIPPGILLLHSLNARQRQNCRAFLFWPFLGRDAQTCHVLASAPDTLLGDADIAGLVVEAERLIAARCHRDVQACLRELCGE